MLEVDLTRDWQDCLVACDASDVFGFGVSVMPCDTGTLKRLGCRGLKRDAYVRLDPSQPGEHDEDERPRKGTLLQMPFSKSAFKTVISSKRRFDGHPGALEAHGVALALKWLLRAPKRHSRRTVVLIDAQAVLGATAKGRSSAPTLRREVRHISALLLAGDLLYKPVYIPSEDNPADAPSRGLTKRRSKMVRKGVIKPRSIKQDRCRLSRGAAKRAANSAMVSRCSHMLMNLL
jgi:hypothetical protein